MVCNTGIPGVIIQSVEADHPGDLWCRTGTPFCGVLSFLVGLNMPFGPGTYGPEEEELRRLLQGNRLGGLSSALAQMSMGGFNPGSVAMAGLGSIPPVSQSVPPENTTPEGFEKERRQKLIAQLGHSGSVVPQGIIPEPWMAEAAGYASMDDARKPGARYNFGFGNVPESVREPRSVDEMMKASQRNAMLRGLTPSQRRQLDVPVKKSGLQEILDRETRPFQPTAGQVGSSVVSVGPGGKAVVQGMMTPKMAKSDYIQKLIERKNRIKDAREQRIAEAKLIRDKDLSLDPANATTPFQAGIIAVQQFRRTVEENGGTPTRKQLEDAFRFGLNRHREAEKARREQSTLDAQLTTQKDIADLQVKAEAERARLDRESAEKLAKKNRKAQRESDLLKDEGYKDERFSNAAATAEQTWREIHGGKAPRTERDFAEIEEMRNRYIRERPLLDKFVRERDREGDQVRTTSPPPPPPSPLESQSNVKADLSNPESEINSIYSLLGVKPDAPVNELAAALWKRMNSSSPLRADELGMFREHILERDNVDDFVPEKYFAKMTSPEQYFLDELLNSYLPGGRTKKYPSLDMPLNPMQRAKMRFEVGSRTKFPPLPKDAFSGPSLYGGYMGT